MKIYIYIYIYTYIHNTYIYAYIYVVGAFSPNGSTCSRSMGNGTIVLRSGAKTKNHKKRNFVKNACRLL